MVVDMDMRVVEVVVNGDTKAEALGEDIIVEEGWVLEEEEEIPNKLIENE